MARSRPQPSNDGLAKSRPRRSVKNPPIYVTPRQARQPKSKEPVSGAKKANKKRQNSVDKPIDNKRVKLSRSATLDISPMTIAVVSLKRTRTSLSQVTPILTKHTSSIVESVRKKAKKMNVKKLTAKNKSSAKKVPKAKVAKVKKVKAPKLAKKTGRKTAQLTPRLNFPHYEAELTFESKEVVPFVSVESYSKLGIRATILNNEALLKRLINDTQNVSTVHVPRSINIDRDPLTYALVNNNLKLVDLLAADAANPKPHRVKRIESLLDKQQTGMANIVMLGHPTRQITMTRGAKEGNNAFTKEYPRINWRLRIKQALQENVDITTIQHVVNSSYARTNDVSMQIFEAIRYGNRKLAGKLIELYGSYGFNELHKQVLLNDKQPLKPFKAISVKKKGLDNKDVTPLHCACINPNENYLKELVAVEPDINHPDKDNLRASHYVAACEGTKPLEFLLNKGISPYDVDKQGNQPLHIAAKAGRAANIRVLCEFIKKSDPNLACINQKNRQSFTPLHIAAMKGHPDAARMLIKCGALVDPQTGASKAHITPLMLACQHGHLDLVKILVEAGAQVNKRDKLKRTALTHAVIDGNSHIASYLLMLGADPDVADNSGNSVVHYAAAYGWYFCLKMLIDAGAKVNVFNDWKLTPLGVAYMKGHMGLADMLLQQPGIDLNCQDENGMTLVALTLAGGGVVSPSTLEQLNYLIVEKKADCTVKDSHGNSALHTLAASEVPTVNIRNIINADEVKKRIQLQLKIAQLLLDHNCEPNDLNDEKLPPCMIAAKRGNMALANFLMKKGSRVTTEGRDSELQPTILHYLVSNGNETDGTELLESLQLFQPEEVQKMLEMRNEKRQTPFIMACGDLTDDNFVFRKKIIAQMLKIYPEAMWQQTLVKKPVVDDKADDKQSQIDGESEKEVEEKEEKEDGDEEEEEEEEDEEDEEEETNPTEEDVVEYVDGPSVFHFVSPLKSEMEKLEVDATKFLLSECKKYPKVMRKGSKCCLNLLDQDGLTPLFKAIQGSHELAALELAASGADVNFCGFYQDTKVNEPRVKNVSCLMYAIKLGLTKLADYLVTAGADCSIRDSSGKTAVHYASMFNNFNMIGIVEKLIKSGAKVGDSDLKLRTPLHYAINADTGSTDMSTEIVELLIGNGASLMDKDIRGRTPLHYAFVKIGRHKDISTTDPIGICSLLLKDARDIRMDMLAGPDAYGCTPLHYAAMRGSNISCMTLMNHKVDLNAMNNEGNTPLGVAVKHNQLSCTLTLIQGGADIHIPFKEVSDAGQKRYNSTAEYEKANRWRWTPLKDLRTKVESISVPAGIIRNDWQGVVFIMIDLFEQEQKSFFSLLKAAIEYRKYNLALTLIRMIKSKKMKFSQENPAGQDNLLYTLAKTALPGDNEELQIILAKELLSLGMEMVDNKRPTCPHAAFGTAENQNLRLLQFFAEQSGWENIVRLKQSDGHTIVTKLLRNAITDEMEKMVKMLMEKYKVTLDCIAEYRVFLDYSPFLTDTIVVSEPEPVKLTPLIYAILSGKVALVQFLIQLGANPDFPTQQGVTPLMFAARMNNLTMLKVLLNKDFVVDPKMDLVATETEEENAEENDSDTSSNSEAMSDDNSEDSDYERPKKKARNYAVDRRFAPTKPMPKFHPISQLSAEGSTLNTAVGENKPADTAPFKVKSKVNLSAKDHMGRSILHYWVSPLNLGTWANLDLLEFFIFIKLPLDLKDKSGKTPFDVAKDNGYVHIAERLKNELKLKASVDIAYQPTAEFQPSSVLAAPVNYRNYANVYLENKAKILESKRPKERDLKPHNLSGHRDNGVLVVDDDLDLPYDVLLNKVDVKRGIWGFYNFYRMQLIKRKGSELFVLFTNWGRIGDKGQYQKTPYKDLSGALLEFKRVFKSKSGNDWSNIKNFTEIPNKYRLIAVEEVKRPQLPDIDIQLTSSVKCQLPKDLQALIADISDVKMLQRNSRSVAGRFSLLLPFGLVKRPIILKAREVLLDICAVMEDIDKLAAQPVTKDSIEKKQVFLQKCADLSNEFYHCLPFSGFGDCQLEVIDNKDRWSIFLKAVDNMLELEQAAAIIAAAAYNSIQIHPYDYIYR